MFTIAVPQVLTPAYNPIKFFFASTNSGFAIVGSQMMEDKSIAVGLMDLQNQENAIVPKE